MKQKIISWVIVFSLCVACLNCNAYAQNANDIVTYLTEIEGTSYTYGYCLGFVHKSFENVYGYRAYNCCAYKSGSIYVDSTSRDIPIGACVYFSGSKTTCETCWNKAGHVGIYIGNGNIMHNWDGKVTKSSIDYVVSRGYPYRGWGWLCDNPLDQYTELPSNILGNSVDIGTNFFAYIINYSSWLPIAVNSEGNVVLEKETGMQNQLWKFTLLPDGSYKIISLLDGKSLDVDCAKTEAETNIKSEIFTDSEAQHWYIYGSDSSYKLKAKCTDCVMDVGGGSLSEGANIQTYTYNNTMAQNFQIYKVDPTFALGKPIDIGDDFTAYIINDKSALPIAVTSDRNVVLDTETKMQKQLWHFNKLSDGSYKIVSLLDGKSLDVDCAKNELNTNIKSELFTDSEAQHWYIYGKDGNYKLKAKCTDYVMDVGGGSLSEGANIQTYVYNDSEAQKFDIVKLNVDRCPITKTKIIDDKMYLLFDNEKDLSWSEAKYLCKQLGGYLATITSEEENILLTQLIKSGSKTEYYIGGTDESIEGVWQWDNGEKFNYNNWNISRSEPNNSNCNEHYLVLESDGLWNDQSISPTNIARIGFICEIDLESIKTTNKDKIYILFNNETNLSWKDAKYYCEQLDGYLATITSEEENILLSKLLQEGTKPEYYLGGTDESKEGVWNWINSEPWKYENWNSASNEPNNADGKEHYLTIKKSDTLWNDFSLKPTNAAQTGFICEIDIPSAHIETTLKNISSNYCSIETVLHNINSSCTIIIASYNKGQLVTIEKKAYLGYNQSFSVNANIDEIKVMVWDGLSTIKPLCKAEIIQNTEFITE